jgi:hypothetical protein
MKLPPMKMHRITTLLETSGGDIYFMPYREVDAAFIVADITEGTTTIMTMDQIEEKYDIFPEAKEAIVALFEINSEEESCLTEQESKAIRELKDVFDKKLSGHFRKRVEKADKRYELFLKGVRYQPEDLTWAATARCVCGHGMAYPTNCGSHRQWECSGILTGKGDPKLLHLSPRPFALYEIKSDDQPSAYGASTREPIEPMSEAYPKTGQPRNLRCDGCGKVVDVSEGGAHEGCGWVYGRRGWRQLGAYDS